MTYASPNFVLHQGDTLPRLAPVVSDSAGPRDLSEVTSVAFHMHGLTTSLDYTGAGFVQDALAGIVGFDFLDSQTQVPGYYSGWFVLTYDNGQVQSFPNGLPFLIEVAAA